MSQPDELQALLSLYVEVDIQHIFEIICVIGYELLKLNAHCLRKQIQVFKKKHLKTVTHMTLITKAVIGHRELANWHSL